MFMISTPVVFFACCALFLLLCRALSAPDVKVKPAIAVAMGGISVGVLAWGMTWMSPSPWTLGAVICAAAVGSSGLQGRGLADFTGALGRWRFSIYLLSVGTLTALIYVCIPITTFLTSPGEIKLSLEYLFGVNARNALTLVYVSAFVYVLAATSRMRTALTILVVAALLLALLYAFMLPFGYPMMSGLTFEQMPVPAIQRAIRVLVDVAILGLLCVGLRTLIIRSRGQRLFVALAIVCVSLSVAVGINIRREIAGAAGGPESESTLAAQPLRFSKTQPNTLIIFLDRFMGSYVEQILQSDPGIEQSFRGFTWYPRTVAAGENSIAGVHPMLGGYDYLPVEMNSRGKSLLDLSVEAFSILPYNFSRRGYQVNFVSPRGLGFTMAGDCKHLRMAAVTCTHIPSTYAAKRAGQLDFPLTELASSNYTDLLAVLSGMRVAPYAFKELLLRKGPWRKLLDHSAGTTFREWAELEALGAMTRVDATTPSFNFISNILPHEPYFMGEDCKPRRTRLEVPEDEVTRRGHKSLFSLQHAITARCALLLVGSYMEFLKQRGAYDNARIVIVSDHGIVSTNAVVEDHSSRAIAGGTQGREFVNTRSLLMVKPRGATGALRISETFLPNAEVPRIVCEDIGGCVNPFLGNRPIATDGRDDPFHVSLVPWQFNLQKPRAFVIRRQLILTGKDPFDALGWQVSSAAASP